MENKETFFNGCKRIRANENFNWSVFYLNEEYDPRTSSLKSLCGTTGCLMHEYPKITDCFSYGASGVIYNKPGTRERSAFEGAFSEYHDVSYQVASIIVYHDRTSYDVLTGIDAIPFDKKALEIMKLNTEDVKADQAIYLFLHVLLGTGELTREEIPIDLLSIYDGK